MTRDGMMEKEVCKAQSVKTIANEKPYFRCDKIALNHNRHN